MMLEIKMIYKFVELWVFEQLLHQWKFNDGRVNIQLDNDEIILIKVVQNQIEGVEMGFLVGADTDIDPVVC